MRICFILSFAFILLLSSFSPLFAAHGISIDGQLKYAKGFKKFDYTSDQAVKGGRLVLHDLGSFDKMNPFTLKGIAPMGLEMFVFEKLADSSLDEPFAKYGLLAKDITIARDKLSMVFALDEQARFSDGSTVTPEDVKFSLEIIKSDKVHPFYPYFYRDIIGSDILDDRRIRFRFARVNRELPMIAADIPIMSKKFYSKYGFGNGDDLTPPIGSGPYIVESVNHGKSIKYRRNPNYWAKNKPVRRGMYNYDTITVQYYKDQIVSVEAFKAGEYDFMLVNIAKQWARDMSGRKFETGKIHKKLYPHMNNAGMQGFVFNTRREIFKDWRVRKALGLAFDFEWTNQALFYKQYARANSFFSNSYLAASGVPQGLEREYLEAHKKNIPADVFTSPLIPPVNLVKSDLRRHLIEAQELLKQAGWEVKGGILKNREGKIFEFEMILASPAFLRVIAPYAQNLRRLGINITYRQVDLTLYTDRVKKFDFDMVVNVFGQSLSPGNEQRNYWHSEKANQTGGRNLAGIQSPVVDDLVEKIIYATTQEELTAACKALDRVLWYGYFVIPNWYMDSHRLVYYNKFAQPQKLPVYYNHYQLLTTWWIKPTMVKVVQ